MSTRNKLIIIKQFLLGLPLSSIIADAVLAFSGKTFCAIFVLRDFVSNGVKKSTESFTNLAGIVSNAIRIFHVEIFRKIFNFTSLAVLKESLSPLKTSDPLTSSLIFIMLG